MRPKRQAAISARAQGRKANDVMTDHSSSESTTSVVTALSVTLEESDEEKLKRRSSTKHNPSPQRGRPPSASNSSPQRGRPPSGSNYTPKGPYRRLDDFKALSPGVRDLAFWIECTEGARSIKRAGRRDRKPRILERPPVDLVIVKSIKMTKKEEISAMTETKINFGNLKILKVKHQITKEEFSEITIKKINEDESLKVTIGKAQSSEDSFCFIYAGNGGISALDWSPPIESRQFLALACYPTVGYTDPWAVAIEDGGSCPKIQIWAIDTLSGKIKGRLISRFCHNFGIVRGLYWCPKAPILLAIFGDGKARVWPFESLNDQMEFELGEEDCLTIGEDRFVITTAAWSIKEESDDDDSKMFFFVGTNDGRILYYRINQDGTFSCLAGVKLSEMPITSISPNDKDPMVVGIGLHGSPAMVVNLTEPFERAILHSPLALVPLVRWSSIHDAWIFADSEQAIRAIGAQNLIERNSFPIATFDGPVSDVAISNLHNVIAVADYNGAIHLSHLGMSKNCILFEQCILEMNVTDEMVIVKPVLMPATTNGTKRTPLNLPTIGTSIPFIKWSRSTTSPGLLAVSSGARGLVIVFSVDHRCLLPPGQ